MSFWCLFQKTNKNKSTIIVVKSNFFVRFLGPRFLEELRIPKSPFEINWPLVLILNLRPRTTNSVFISIVEFVFFYSSAEAISSSMKLKCQKISICECEKLKSRRVWGWFVPKTFQGLHFFVFWVTWLVDSFLSYLPEKRIWRTNLKKKSSVYLWRIVAFELISFTVSWIVDVWMVDISAVFLVCSILKFKTSKINRSIFK